MRIGIIGAGHIGGALARRLTQVGHQVSVANSRGPQTLQELASDTGAKAATVPEAVRDAELVVVTIPMKKIPGLPAGLFRDAAPDLIVVDTCNYYPRQRDGLIDAIEAGMVESRWVEQQINHPVVKAFNNIYAHHLRDLGQPAATHGRIALPVAGDDERAKKVVLEIVNQLGFDGVDAGGLDESWRQQPGTPVYAQDFDAAGVRRALQQARPQRTPEWRATPNSPGTYKVPA